MKDRLRTCSECKETMHDSNFHSYRSRVGTLMRMPKCKICYNQKQVMSKKKADKSPVEMKPEHSLLDYFPKPACKCNR